MSPSTHPDPNPDPNLNPNPNPNSIPNQVDYDVTFAVVATTALSFAWQAAAPLVERIELPATLSPTYARQGSNPRLADPRQDCYSRV